MDPKVEQEIKKIIEYYKPNYSVNEFIEKINWRDVSRHKNLSEDFIREFQDKVYWYNISQFQKLSEPFIREFQDKVYWCNISQFQELSEPFIREFQDKVNWMIISTYQKLSEDFVREFKDKLENQEVQPPSDLPTKKIVSAIIVTSVACVVFIVVIANVQSLDEFQRKFYAPLAAVVLLIIGNIAWSMLKTIFKKW